MAKATLGYYDETLGKYVSIGVESISDGVDEFNVTRLKNNESALNTHSANTQVHITQDERAVWNAKETPEGAQAKANATQVHKITLDNGMTKPTPSSNLNSILTKGEYICDSTNSNTPASGSGLLEVFQVSSVLVLQRYTTLGVIGRKTFVRQYNGTSWTAWNSYVMDSELDWKDLTLQNGWTTGVGRVPQYAVNGGEIVFRGVITGGTVIQADPYVPAFTLPAGSRPGFTGSYLLGGISGLLSARAYAFSDGRVCIVEVSTGTTGSIDLSGLIIRMK